MSYQLCKEFPALTPYDLDEKQFCKVIDLYSDVRRVQIREKKTASLPVPEKKEKVIRRPAGDNWF